MIKAFLNIFNNNSFAAASSHSSRRISILIYAVLASIIVDTIINQNIDIRNSIEMSSAKSIALFLALAAIAIVGQYYILGFVGQKSRQIRNKVRYLNISYKVAVIIQCLLIAVFLFVIAEIVANWRYPSATLAVVTAASYGLNIGLMAVYAKIFFSWYKSNRNSIAVLLYGLSFAVVVITSCVFLSISYHRFVEKPTYIFSDWDMHLTKAKPGSILYTLLKVYHYSDIVSFALKWVATAFLLYHYSQKMGRAKYWILISLPLVYFLTTYLDDFQLYEPHAESEVFYWNLYVTSNSTAGGILFYVGFVLAAKHFHHGRGNVNWAVEDYLLICGFGFLLFFSAGQSTLGNSLYPPYGLATMSFYGLSSFLILLGLYASAFSVSEDVELRKSIRKSTLRESKFLDSMGTAYMEKELIKRMVLKAREEQKELAQESGGVTSSLNEEDIISIVREAEKDAKKESV
jgi:hypothetical protein